jgi:hypothetical protein
MSALRDEIRAILREEIAALRGELEPAPEPELVSISSSADLNRFAQDLLERVADPIFAAQMASGQINFALMGTPVAAQQQRARPIVTSPPKPAGVIIDKALVTESDISDLGETARAVRVSHQSRLTPLAKDEARRKGIRIERIEA